MKAGGLLNGLKLAQLAGAAGLPCMIGCMVESRIGIGAATHLALATNSISFADLDGHLFLATDIVSEGVETQAGINKLPIGKVGLCTEVREDLLEAL
jgi:L-alanine-DL-glutamate epimerase-like enolase superfamily enzyme